MGTDARALGGEALSLAVLRDTLFAGTKAGLFRSADGGRTWSPLDVAYAEVTALAPAGRDLMVAAQGQGLFLVSGDGKRKTRTGLPAPVIASVAAVGPDPRHRLGRVGRPPLRRHFAATAANGVFGSDDGGATWNESGADLPLNTNGATVAASGRDAGDGLGNFGFYFVAAHAGSLFAGNEEGVFRCPADGGAWGRNYRRQALIAAGAALFAGTAGRGVGRCVPE